ncbi:hypothetical protein VZT92_011166 [Zoarces viviparus]|uniref:Uncharacterized protein n=1 Tax=Zoarces viviparus TaxID=48416 RepID=A0AAW1FB87_ZOAVI
MLIKYAGYQDEMNNRKESSVISSPTGVSACSPRHTHWRRIAPWRLPIRAVAGAAAMVAMQLKEAWHGAPHDKVSAPPWTALGDCGGTLISLCQGLSASVLFTPQVCWLLADCSAKDPSYQPAES